MFFEQTIDIDAPVERVWDVISDIEAWPQRIETVDSVELLSPPPVSTGSHVRLKQPKLPEGTWEVTAWDPPTFFEWRQKSNGVTTVAGHRVDSNGEGSRLTLSLDMRGLLIPIVGLFYRGLITRYMQAEALGMKTAAEATGQ